MKIFIVLLISAILFSCSTNPSATTTPVDSTTTSADSSAIPVQPVSTEPEVPINYSTRISNIQGADTLFNFLADQKLLQGQFVSVYVTENFIDVSNLSRKRTLIAALIITGDGEPSGAREGVMFAALFSSIVVMEKDENDQWKMIDFKDVGDISNYGLVAGEFEGSDIQLTDDKLGIKVHSKSSEEGAGDSGFKREDMVAYVLLNEKITPVFETPLLEYSFSSDESTSWSETTTTTSITVLDSKTKGLFDIEVITETSSSGYSEDPDGEEQPQDTPSEEQVEEEPQIPVYKWTGTKYELP